MSAEPVNCPYCNSFVAAAASPRLTCPRCGESFPYHGDPSLNGTPTPEAQPDLTPTTTSSARWSNRAVAGLVVGIMALAAAGGLSFALLTIKARRAHDNLSQPTASVAPTVRSVLPAELTGLGYLPPGTNLITAIHVADAMRTPTGRAFLEQAELAGTGFHIADLERDVGIRRDDIDHVVFGLRLQKQQFRPVLIVQTRQPYQVKSLLEGLKAGRPEKVGKKEVHHFNVNKPSLSAMLWCASPNTVVVTISRDDMAAVPDTPAAGLDHLPDSLQKFIAERLKLGTQAWLAGHVDDWEAVRPFAAALLSEETQKLIAGLRTFGLWLRLDDQVQVRGAAQCTDAAAAELLEKTLTKRLARDNKYLNVLGSTPEGEKVAEELARSLKVVQQDASVTLEATASSETVRKAVGK